DILTKKLFLLDGHSLAHRAFYALPTLTNQNGENTNAVYGFARMLFNLIDNHSPDLLSVAFDKKGPTFRHEEYEEYKGDRKKMPDELSEQIPVIKEMLENLNIPIFEKTGYEADDIIGTLAKRGEEEGWHVIIVTGDRDALQLVTKNIEVMYTKKGISDITEYTLDKVREKYELEPEQLIDLKGLMGDSSDNIPGVPGIGIKTGTKLLKEFDSMENVLDNIENVSGKKRKENLKKYKEQAKTSKMLGKILQDIPLDLTLSDLNYDELNESEKDEIIKLFEHLEFKSLVERFKNLEEIKSEDIEIHNIKENEKLNDLLQSCKEKDRLAIYLNLDNFSDAVNSKLKEVIIALNENEIYAVNMDDFNIKDFKNILENKNIKKLMLRAKEAMIYTKKYDININSLHFEPLLAKYLLNPSDKLIDINTLYKEELDFELGENLSDKKAKAVKIANLYKLEEILLKDLEKNNLLDLYNEIELPLIPSLAQMELNGIKVDKEYLNQLSKMWEEKINNIVEKAHELAGEKFNLNSPKQVGEILFEKLGLPVIKKTKTGYSTSIKVLEKLEDKHEIIPLIMEFRKWSKLKSTYVDALPPLINEEDGRIHTSFNQMITATGRLSSTDPNLQNIPIRTKEGRAVRKAFIPKNDNWLFLAADYSQVELRVLAHISDDKSLTDAFQNKLDIHTETASKIFEVDPGEVTSNMRRHAKVINFGIAYGMSAYGLSQDLDISQKEAQEYIDKYFNRFSGVKKYMDEITQKAKDDGYVSTIFNRKRYIADINSSNFHKRSFAKRAAINTPIQGSAADIMKMAMIDVYDYLKNTQYEANLLLQVHDELILEVKKEDLNKIAKDIKKIMEETVALSVPLVVDLQTGKNWRDKDDYEVTSNA
ncbi:MAG: DNA polymerase I, partial [Bacillota bacterium]